MKNETKVWDLFTPVYNVFMRTNRTAYERMYTNIRAVIKDKNVLEIACRTGLISKNVANVSESYIATDFSENMLKTARKGYVLETLRVLKKGGTFAIHDIMSEQRYGDMWEFTDRLIEMGYKDVKLIDTTDGMFMTKCEAKVLGLSGSTLLTGTK